MSLLEKHQRFLLAAVAGAGQENRPFNLTAVGALLDHATEETNEIARVLEKHGLLNILPGGQANLTTLGVTRAASLRTKANPS